MIGIFRKLSIYSTAARYTRYSAIRLCSNESNQPDDKSDNDLKAAAKHTLSKSTSFHPKKIENERYSISEDENNRSVLNLFESIPSDAGKFNVKALKSFYHEIRGKYLITKFLTLHPKFDVLRTATKRKLPILDAYEVSDIFISLLPSKVIMFDMISEHIVDALLKNVNHFTFYHMLFLDYLIHKYYSLNELSKSYNILRLTIQTQFLSKIDDELDGLEDYGKLIKILAFCENNVDLIPDKVLNAITTSLLMADNDQFSIENLMSIIIFLANFGQLNEHVQKLLEKSTNLWCQSNVSAKHIEVLFRILKKKRNTINKEMFENTDFIRYCVNVIIQNNDKMTLFAVQNYFNSVGFVSESLIDRLSTYFQSKESLRQLTFHDYLIICRACHKSGYKPKNWQSKIVDALKSFNFSVYLNTLGSFDWVKFALSLNDLGYCDTQLIESILKAEYIKKKHNYDVEQLEKLQEILDQKNADLAKDNIAVDNEYGLKEAFVNASAENVPCSVYKDLKSMFGDNFIRENVQIKANLKIPFVLKMDLESGNFLPINEIHTKLLASKHKLFAIIVVNNDFKREDAKNQSYQLHKEYHIPSIVIDQTKWDNLKSYEKSQQFYRKVMKAMSIYEGEIEHSFEY
ncbi:uncharacterized protein LOC116339655 isoform X2 [Contarinia nasturtii]|uniref:uncharacterized protein LOC116339655 isoform X2 n=1 Tax=Contarinia nasturtii TaxID=265458 RepID=UPI0012D413D6|nr:uncharacterized protein LOC116339655 isoform X2 [Contarinia nasturtii]